MGGPCAEQSVHAQLHMHSKFTGRTWKGVIKTRVYKEYFMLYGTEGGGRGQKSKYTVLPRGGRVQFDF